jgi:hypothetical protein
MNCACPKCQAQIEIDNTRISDSGTSMPCPECKSRFWIAKEAYSRMSLKKEGYVYCDQCGKELEHKIVCGSCGIMYPDYYIIQASKPPRRQIEKPDYFSFNFTSRAAISSQNYDYTYSSTRESSGWSLGLSFKKIATVAVVILVAVALGVFYQMRKAEQQFAGNYMRALYAIKTGNEMGVKTCSKISADWKTGGQNFVPRISSDDEARLTKVKDVIDRYMSKVNDPPKKFAANKDKLANLYNVFTRTYSLATAPSGSISSFDTAIAKSQSDFDSSVATLKENMPGALSKELQVAKTKYRGMQNI